MTENMKEWALYYASLGLAVFPLRSRSKTPATKNGFTDATTSAKQIETWWSRWPDCNIGIATGQASGGLVVVDLDIDEDKGVNGYETLKEWQREHGELPETWQSITGRGGYHLFFHNSDVCKSRVGLYEGVDIRADGGYIVAPPSIHPNGRTYEWEQPPDEQALAIVTSVVSAFLDGPPCGAGGSFEMPEVMPEGERTNTLVGLVGCLKAKGLTDDSIRAAVRVENEKCCVPPLSDQELEKTVFPTLTRGWKASAPYNAQHKTVCDRGRARQLKECSSDLVPLDHIEEKAPEWFIPEYIPRYGITSLAGDGGCGKTTVWCALAAAASSGKMPFLLSDFPFKNDEPQKVVFFSAEDSPEYTLKRRLRKNGAQMDNILTIGIADERFRDIKFNSPLLERILAEHRPALCIFDPIQAFVPPEIRMGDRNAMRNCLEALVGYGEKYGTTFLIIEHANKQAGVWGRKRIADSADIWDISRSVIMAGETNEKGIRYLSHEKSNLGPTAGTVLYTIEDEVVKFWGHTDKKDKDFVTEIDYNSRQKPQRDEAKEFIFDFLKDGEKEVSELDGMAKAVGISTNALKNAKSDLKKDGKIRTWSTGYGQDKKYFVCLLENVSIASEKVNE